MSTFLILPSRPETGARIAELLAPLVPQSAWQAQDWGTLAQLLEEALQKRGDMIAVFAEDLASEGSVESELAAHFGAEPEDRILSRIPEWSKTSKLPELAA